MVEKDEKVRWIKMGGGSHYLRRPNGKKKRIKPGEKFWAKPSEIPESMRDIIKPLEDIPDEILPSSTKFEVKEREAEGSDAKTAEGTDTGSETEGAEGTGSTEGAEGKPGHEVQARDEAPGWFDVINVASGKPMNEKGLREHEAKELLTSLES